MTAVPGSAESGERPAQTISLRLPRQTRIAFAGCAAFAVVGILLVILADDADGRSAGLLAAGFFGGLVALSLFLPRAVTFGDRALTVHRRLLSDTQIRYGDITGFGLGRILSRTGRFGWAQFENAQEVDDAFGRFIQSGTIPADHLSAHSLKSDLIGLKASVYGVYTLLGLGALGLALWVAGVPVPTWMWSGPNWLNEVFLPIVVYLVATGIAYLVIRHRIRQDRPD